MLFTGIDCVIVKIPAFPPSSGPFLRGPCRIEDPFTNGGSGKVTSLVQGTWVEVARATSKQGLRAIGWFCHYCLPSARTGSDPNSRCSFGVPEWVGHQPGAGPSVHTSEKAACSSQTEIGVGRRLLMPPHLAKANIPPPVQNYSEYYMWLCIESAWKK